MDRPPLLETTRRAFLARFQKEQIVFAVGAWDQRWDSQSVGAVTSSARGDLMSVWAKWAVRARESDPGEGIGCWRPCSLRARGLPALATARRRPLGVTWSRALRFSRRVSLSRGCVTAQGTSRRRSRGGFGRKALRLLALRRLLHPSFSNTAAALWLGSGSDSDPS